MMLEVDWQHLFGIEKSVLELVIRGTAFYWFLFIVFRFVLRRDVGAVGIADILLIVLIADASQNAMADDYRSLTEGAIVVGTLVLWNLFLQWLGFHWRAFERFADAPPLLLIRNGQLLKGNMRREWMTEDELMSKLREQGIERAAEVKWAYMESNGQISVRKASGEADRRGDNGAQGATPAG